MHRSPASRRGPATITLLLAAVAVLAVACSPVSGGQPSASPSPTPAPTAPATPEPSVAPSDPVDGVTVDLDIATDHDVSVVVQDASGDVVDVASGRAGDGMSVRWFDVVVENIDDRTVRVTWVGLPIDEVIDLTIASTDGGYRFDFDQDAPPANSDAIGFDRVLIVEFASPIDAADIDVSFPAPQPA